MNREVVEMSYAGADWIKGSLKKELSPLGESVADLIGEWYRGIYHISIHTLYRVEWSDKNMISIALPGDFSTFDFNDLTRLVFLAHWFAIRVEIEPCNFRFLKFRFTQRRREGVIFELHPTLDQAVSMFKEEMRADGIEEWVG